MLSAHLFLIFFTGTVSPFNTVFVWRVITFDVNFVMGRTTHVRYVGISSSNPHQRVLPFTAINHLIFFIAAYVIPPRTGLSRVNID